MALGEELIKAFGLEHAVFKWLLMVRTDDIFPGGQDLDVPSHSGVDWDAVRPYWSCYIDSDGGKPNMKCAVETTTEHMPKAYP